MTCAPSSDPAPLPPRRRHCCPSSLYLRRGAGNGWSSMYGLGNGFRVVWAAGRRFTAKGCAAIDSSLRVLAVCLQGFTFPVPSTATGVDNQILTNPKRSNDMISYILHGKQPTCRRRLQALRRRDSPHRSAVRHVQAQQWPWRRCLGPAEVAERRAGGRPVILRERLQAFTVSPASESAPCSARIRAQCSHSPPPHNPERARHRKPLAHKLTIKLHHL